jgi:hypothetical protein
MFWGNLVCDTPDYTSRDACCKGRIGWNRGQKVKVFFASEKVD